jgi:hypothetical protein
VIIFQAKNLALSKTHLFLGQTIQTQGASGDAT